MVSVDVNDNVQLNVLGRGVDILGTKWTLSTMLTIYLRLTRGSGPFPVATEVSLAVELRSCVNREVNRAMDLSSHSQYTPSTPFPRPQ